MTGKIVVSTTAAPAPAHTYSQGLRKGGLLQVSGQGPMDPATSTYIGEGDVREQTLRTLENVRAIIEAGGATLEDVIMMRVYLTTRADFPAMNEVYAAYMAEHVPSGELPCRTTVFVDLPHEVMLVEIDALAAV
ncbi:RidA family protein [Pseudonocardia sp. TRM90224]|uniref:RidA family protein n=1 Tax=Pseudonocardia sp. TRM90224 TaxID=2812678 RepID=UPI001E3D18A8|nr:RidA family protein [Pseudonocardia sp. TRM90224]